MQVLYPRCAGLDAHKDTVWPACAACRRRRTMRPAASRPPRAACSLWASGWARIAAPPGHLISWAGPCPRNDEGAGKRRSTRVRRSGTWLKTTLVTAAWAAVRVKSGCLHGQPLRLKARRGAKKAILAGAASMLTAIYVMLRNRVPYRDLGPQHFDQRQRTRTIRRLLRRLHDLGCPVTISSSVPPSTVIASAP